MYALCYVPSMIIWRMKVYVLISMIDNVLFLAVDLIFVVCLP